MRVIRGIHAVADRLELALDDRQRRAQLVADIRHERPTLLVRRRRQPIAHLVEGPGEESQLGRPGLGHARGVIALLHAPGGLDELVHGRARGTQDPRCEARDHEQQHAR